MTDSLKYADNLETGFDGRMNQLIKDNQLLEAVKNDPGKTGSR